jgi:carbamoyl-phosphate synthase/aspartate carbamoyltransferase/dihydroorotase
MRPPLKRASDRDALWANFDVIDMIATDHAPHTIEEKEGDTPAFGVPGLETSLPLMLTAVHDGKLSLDRLIEMMYNAPARIFKLGTKPQPQTYIEVDLAHRWTITTQGMQSKCGWTPFAGMDVIGAVRTVVLRGQTVVENGEITAEPGVGIIIAPKEESQLKGAGNGETKK